MGEIRVKSITGQAAESGPEVPFGIPGLWVNGGQVRAFGGTTATTANLHRVRRNIEDKTHYFNNIQFDLNSADKSNWSSPSSRKWAYVYLDPTDSAFYISDNAPIFGDNTKVINGTVMPYIFPIYANSSNFLDFHLWGSWYIILAANAKRGYSNNYSEGNTLYYNQSLSYLDTTENLSEEIPDTGVFLNLSMMGQAKFRNDGGGFSQSYFNIRAPRLNTNDTYSLFDIRRINYIDTPINGNYFPYITYDSSGWFPKDSIDFSAIRVRFDNGDSGYSDGISNIAFNLHGFVDGGIF